MDDLDRTVKAVSANLQWELDSHTVTFLTTYRDRVEDTVLEDYTRNINQAWASDSKRAEGAELFSAELRLTSNLDGPLNYISGLYYYSEDSELYPLSQNFLDPFDPVGFALRITGGGTTFFPGITTSDANVTSSAVYGDLTYEISDSFTLFGGLRYTMHDVEAATGSNGPPTSNSFQEDETDLSGRLGFQWRASDRSMLYASVARGFKGQFLEVPVVGDTEILPAETSMAYEIGYKSSLTDSLDLEANIFYADIDNYQGLFSFFIPGGALISNSVVFDVKAKGFEATLRGVAGDNFEYVLAYMNTDAPYPDGYLGAQGGDIGGEPLVGTPKNKFTFSGEYFSSLGSNEWFFNYNGYWKDDVRYEASAGDLYVYDAHWHIGASVGLRSPDGTWRVSLFGRNLTGEDEPIAFLSSSTEWNGPPAALDGGVRAWPAAGVTVRQVGVSVDYNFGN
jgi:iron complex outermembrane receptor protein